MSTPVRNLAKMFEDKAKASTAGDQRVAAGLAASRGRVLSVAKLIGAGIPGSKNPVLQTIWEAVQDFNQEGQKVNAFSEQAFHLHAILDHIYTYCMVYGSAKWAMSVATHGDHKRIRRYEALKELMDEVTVAYERLGMRRMTGTTDFSAISNDKRNYWLERIDPQNRPGYFLSAQYARWQLAKPVDPVRAGKPESFFDWLNRTSGTLTGSDLANNAKKVQNYGEQPLWTHLVKVEGGVAKTVTDHLFSTQSMRTEFSEHGWGIFVCGGKIPGSPIPGNTIFSASHLAGNFHHSTFLSGSAVVAAGEWIVDTGVIKVITAKSGHYQPRWQDMLAFVRQASGIPGNAIIRPDLTDFAKSGVLKFYTVNDFRATGMDGPPLKRSAVRPMLPGWVNKMVKMPGGDKQLVNLCPA